VREKQVALTYFYITAIGFVVLTILTLWLFLSLETPASLRPLQVAFSGFALLIVMGWVLIGQAWGLTLALLACGLVFFIAWSLQDFRLLTGMFLFSSFAALSVYLKGKFIEQFNKGAVRLEQIQKDKNIIEDGIRAHSQTKDALEKKLKRFSQLKDMIGKLSSTLSTEQIARAITDNTYEAIGKSDEALLYLVNPQQQVLSLAASKRAEDFNSPKTKMGDIFDLWVLKQRQPLIIEDIRKDFRFDAAKTGTEPGSPGSVISAPLVSKEKVLGIIRLNSRESSAYLPDDLRLLDIISHLASVAVENTMLYHRTEQLSIKDGLTGAYVQRYFKDRLAEDVTRCMRSNTNLSLLMLDIDYFKAYNDQHGHSAGDIVLKKVADMLSEMTKDSGDLVARYGGEEFAVVLMGRDKGSAIAFAEEARVKIGQEPIVLRRERTNVTASIGVATLPDDAKVCEDLIKVADDMLYRAKKEGRNKVCSLA